MEKVIKSVKCMGEPFNTDNGLLYNQWVTFDDGSKGLAYSQTAVAPYQAGQLVEVIDTGKKTQKGASKLKIKKIQGETTPQTTQSPSAGAQTPSRGFSQDREKGMRDGMICNVMSRLVASGKSVQEAHSLAMQILACVEGSDDSHPELEAKGGGFGQDKKLAFDPDEDDGSEPPF